jgi:predicted RNA-binding Zn-ribbon protein involved in translation (DUF1610 family)
MAGVWSIPGSNQPARPAQAHAPSFPRPEYLSIECPSCHETEALRVRSSRGAITRLECLTCKVQWKESRQVIRVVVIKTGGRP